MQDKILSPEVEVDDNQPPIQPIEAEENSSNQAESLRFEVSLFRVNLHFAPFLVLHQMQLVAFFVPCNMDCSVGFLNTHMEIGLLSWELIVFIHVMNLT